MKLLFSRCQNLQSVDLWRAQEVSGYAILSLVGLSSGITEENRRILKLSTDEQEELALIYSTVNMPIIVNSFGHLKSLREVDLGWTDPPAGFIRHFLHQIGSTLIKLFLTACRGKSDILSLEICVFPMRKENCLRVSCCSKNKEQIYLI